MHIYTVTYKDGDEKAFKCEVIQFANNALIFMNLDHVRREGQPQSGTVVAAVNFDEVRSIEKVENVH